MKARRDKKSAGLDSRWIPDQVRDDSLLKILIVSNKFKYVLLLIILSILPFISILLNPELQHTSDGEVQIPRMAAFYKAVSDGNFPIRWAGYLNYGYGLPLFNFIYHVPFYVSTALIALGFSLVLTFKLVLLLSFLLSAIFFYLFAKEFFEDERAAFLATILYQFAPFRIIEIFIRGAVGGIYAYTFLPLVLFGVTKLFQKYSRSAFLLTSVSTTLLILSHNSLALLFFGVIVLFTLVFGKTNEARIRCFLALTIGLGIAGFFWIPALFEHKFTYGDLFMRNLYKESFPEFMKFIIPTLFYEKSLRVAAVIVYWGFFQSIIPVIAFLVFFKKKAADGNARKIILFSFVLIAASLFIMHPVSTFVWEHVSSLRQFQFSWRILAVVVFALAFAGGTIAKYPIFKSKFLFWGIIIVTVISTMYYWQPVEGYDIRPDESFYWNYPLNTTYYGETDVIWSGGPAKEYPKSPIEVIAGTATVSGIKKLNSYQHFSISAETDARVVSHTTYFPGWQAEVDGKKADIQFQDMNYRGLITFSVPKGEHLVKVSFKESKIRLVADIVSLISLGGIGLFPFIKRLPFFEVTHKHSI